MEEKVVQSPVSPFTAADDDNNNNNNNNNNDNGMEELSKVER